jgi:hypothetical protein
MLWGFLFTIIKYKDTAHQKALANNYLLRMGENIESSGLTKLGYYD